MQISEEVVDLVVNAIANEAKQVASPDPNAWWPDIAQEIVNRAAQKLVIKEHLYRQHLLFKSR